MVYNLYYMYSMGYNLLNNKSDKPDLGFCKILSDCFFMHCFQ